MGQILRKNIAPAKSAFNPQPSITEPFTPPTIGLDLDFSESSDTSFQHPVEPDSLVEAESLKTR
jgi:hypothetical protein